MSELGQMLRDARESRGISLAEAEEATRIHKKYLQALEDDNYDALPPNVYVRGFLRSYASYLGLDPEEALAAYHDGAQTPTGPQEPQIISEPLVPSPPVNWELVAGVLMLVAVGIILVLVYRQYIAPLATQLAGATPTLAEVLASAPDNTSVPAVIDVDTATPTVTATATPLPPTPVPPTLTPTSEPPPTETPTPVPIQALTLKLTATAPSWIRVIVDGETVFQGTLDPGDEQSWTATREIAMRTGNAGGLTAAVNGLDLGALGGSGEVLDFVWRLSDDGQVITETPAP